MTINVAEGDQQLSGDIVEVDSLAIRQLTSPSTDAGLTDGAGSVFVGNESSWRSADRGVAIGFQHRRRKVLAEKRAGSAHLGFGLGYEVFISDLKVAGVIVIGAS